MKMKGNFFFSHILVYSDNNGLQIITDCISNKAEFYTSYSSTDKR